MVEPLRKFENRCIKIAGVNEILITKSINLQLFTLILYSVGVRCDQKLFSVFSPFIEKSMVTYIVYNSDSIKKNWNHTSSLLWILYLLFQ